MYIYIVFMNKQRKTKFKKYSKHWQGGFFALTIQYIFTARKASWRSIVVSNQSGKFQLHAYDFETGQNHQVTKKSHGALFGSISPDGEYIYYLNDQAGNEHGHFVRTPFFGGKAIDITPNMPPYFSYTISASESNEVLCFTAAFSHENRVYLVPFLRAGNPGIPKIIYQSTAPLSEPIMSPDGIYTCIAETDTGKKRGSNLILIENATGKVLKRAVLRIYGSSVPLAFSQKTTKHVVLALSNASGHYRPVLYDFNHKKVSEITHSSFRGDVFVLQWNEKKDTLLLCDVHKAHHRLFLYSIHTKKVTRIAPTTGSFNLHFDSVVLLSDSSLLLKWNDFNTPPFLLKLKAPRYTSWGEAREFAVHAPTKHSVKSVWFRSSDGERVQMWVVLPKNTKGPIPFVIDIHGGPHGVISDEYSPEAQAWLANGFGYCTVNYRGSIGFGKSFEEKIYGNPGHWEVEDIVAARNWLVKNGYASPEQIVLFGWSWGGYVTLLALGTYPNLWSCGVAGAPIADCMMQYEDEPAFFKAIDQKIFRGTPETVPKRYTKSSPSTYVKNIQAPILIFHGKNDVRCPPRQIQHFEHLLHAAGKHISVEWFSSGHTGEFTNTSLRVSLITKALQFATRATKKKNPLKKKP